MRVRDDEIPVVAQIVEDLCGVILDSSKGYLIESRLGRLAEELGCDDYVALCNKIRSPGNGKLMDRVIDAITTNETLFFRDDSPFQALQHKVIPELLDEKAKTTHPRRLRIWSAACSTGQEPYSIAMILADLIPDVFSWDIKILGTDISDDAVRRASLGTYSKHEIGRGLPNSKLNQYLQATPDGWRIKDSIRSLVSFRRMNLLKPFLGLEPFDVIFCRNVAIYFDADTRKNLFLRLSDHLNPNGYLFVGSSESLRDIGPQFTPTSHCRSTFYRPNLKETPAWHIGSAG